MNRLPESVLKVLYVATKTTSAIGPLADNPHIVLAGSRLGGNGPFAGTANNSVAVGNFYSFDFSGAKIHGTYSLLRCKDRGPRIGFDGLFRCHKRLAGYGFAGC